MIFIQADISPTIHHNTIQNHNVNYSQIKNSKINFILKENNKKIIVNLPSVNSDKILKIAKSYDVEEKVSKIRLANPSKKQNFDNFLKFNEKEIKKNIFSFPIKKLKAVQDPKTKTTPKIILPKNIDYSQAIDTIGLYASVLPNLKTDENGMKRVSTSTPENSLFWLPKPYLTAGSFHAELYPHDTSAVLWSLSMINNAKIRDENLNLMKNQLDNFSFEVENFGYVLNGNRGYQVTRSQTNLIPTNVLWHYKLTKDLSWLKTTGLPLAEKSFAYWTYPIATIMISLKHHNDEENLDLYKWIAHGDGPCYEVISSHKEHNYYYYHVLKTFLEYKELKELPIFAENFNYNKVFVQISNTEAQAILEKISSIEPTKVNNEITGFLLKDKLSAYSIPEPIIEKKGNLYRLTPYYYKSDRLSRVSGYDTNHLYGPFNSFTLDFLPCDHNLILYKSATDLEKIAFYIGDYKKAEDYNLKAKKLKKAILNLFWDKKEGMFFDYNISAKSKRSVYPFASSGYALLSEIFNIKSKTEKKMLIKLVKYLEKNLEGKEGIIASNIETGLHWDKPYSWPIHQIYITGGLRKYSEALKEINDIENSIEFEKIADRISIKHLLANYIDWLSSNGQKIGEKIIAKEENLLTGYAAGSNYSWNLAGVLYLYNNLSDRGKADLKQLLNEKELLANI